METNTTAPSPKVHHGRNIKRLREMLGVKQEHIANELNMTQQAISKLEQKEEIEEDVLAKVAKVLNVPTDAIKNLSDEATFNIISNSYHDQSSAVNYQCNFNPLDIIIEQASKIEELYKELLKSERDKIDVLSNANKSVRELAEEVRKMKEKG